MARRDYYAADDDEAGCAGGCLTEALFWIVLGVLAFLPAPEAWRVFKWVGLLVLALLGGGALAYLHYKRRNRRAARR